MDAALRAALGWLGAVGTKVVTSWRTDIVAGRSPDTRFLVRNEADSPGGVEP
jgi:hypothetical protein